MTDIAEALQRLVIWTKLKCRLQSEPQKLRYFREREIWWAHLGENLGVEQNGKSESFVRPVLVIRKFNESMCWIVPMTTSVRTGPYHVSMSSGTGKKHTSAVVSQLRTISSRRFVRKQRTLPDADFEAVAARLRETFG